MEILGPSSSVNADALPFQSRLEKLQSESSRNVVKTLCHRELIHCYPQGSVLGRIPTEVFDTFLLRQLLVSRNKGQQEAADTSEQSASPSRKRKRSEDSPVARMVLSRTFDPGHGPKPKHLFWVNEMIFAYVRDGYTCFKCENGILKEKYHIRSSRKWKAWDTWYPPDHPILGFKKAIGVLFCTLAEPGNAVNLYYLDTGKRYYQEIKLGDNMKCSEIEPSEEMGKIVLTCRKATLQPDLHFDCVLLDILEPLKSIRFQLKKIATGKRQPENVALCDNQLLLTFRDCVQIFDLNELLASSNEGDPALLNAQDGILVTRVISQLRVPFILLHTKKNRVFSLGFYPQPLQFISEGSVYDIRTQKLVPVAENQPTMLSDLQYRTALSEEEDGRVNFHPDATSRVIFCSKNIFCAASIRAIEDIEGHAEGSELLQQAYMKFDLQQQCNSTRTLVEGFRRSFRAKAKPVNYAEDEDSNVRITYHMANDIDAVVIMEVTSQPPNFKFHFYDCQSWTKMLTIVPKLEEEKKIPSEELSTFTFNVTATEIVVGNLSKTSTKLFVVPLLTDYSTPERKFITVSV